MKHSPQMLIPLVPLGAITCKELCIRPSPLIVDIPSTLNPRELNTGLQVGSETRWGQLTSIIWEIGSDHAFEIQSYVLSRKYVYFTIMWRFLKNRYHWRGLHYQEPYITQVNLLSKEREAISGEHWHTAIFTVCPLPTNWVQILCKLQATYHIQIPT